MTRSEDEPSSDRLEPARIARGSSTMPGVVRGCPAVSCDLERGRSSGGLLAARLVQGRSKRARRQSLSAACRLEHAGAAEEAVEHAVESSHRDRHARVREPATVCLALVAQRIELRGDDERLSTQPPPWK